MEDFHMVIPSNSSPDVYPENKTSTFKVNLPERCELYGDWEAALLEVHYPNTLINIQPGENWIKVLAVEYGTVIPTPPRLNEGAVYLADHERLDLMNKSTSRLQYKFSLRPGLYTESEALANHIADVIRPMTYAQSCAVKTSSDCITVTIALKDNRFFMAAMPHLQDYVVYFAPKLAMQLGLPYDGPFSTGEYIEGIRPINLDLGKPEQMYIYMNLLQDQMVGHTRAPLLRTVPLNPEASFGSMATYRCEHPIYLNVGTKSFDGLEVNIRTDNGHLLPFHSGTLTLVCHFRRRA